VRILDTMKIAALVSIALAADVTAQATRIFNIRATDYKFDAPASVPAGTVSFRMQNDGKEVHHLWLVQLKNGKTYDEFVKTMDSWTSGLMPSWAIDVGGPNDASPGADSYATVTLEPGAYAFVCYVPSPDGRPHVMRGMVKRFTVTKDGATPPREPTADVTIKLTDYNFDLSKPIVAGPQVIRIENTAAQSHEVVIAKLLPGATIAQALRWLNGGQKGPTPVSGMGGASGLSKGRHQYITMTFEPGRYVFLCFIPDAGDLKPHTDHGMAREFTVASRK
jgi:uncharacterized cupredoxin-like copper-binding protein